MKVIKGIGIFTLVIALMYLYVTGVMYLWNWLVPSTFGGPVLDFTKTLGLMVLLKLLFLGNGWHKHRGGGSYWSEERKHRWKRHFEEKCCKKQDEKIN